MAKPNYSFDKRQRDLAKKKQQDEKRLKKLAKKGEGATTDEAPEGGDETEATDANSESPTT